MPRISDRKRLLDALEGQIMYELLDEMTGTDAFMPPLTEAQLLYLMTVHTRYTFHRKILKDNAWNPHIIFERSSSKNQKYLRMEVHTFMSIVHRLESHPIFQNESKCKQAPVQLQLEVFMYFICVSGYGPSRDIIADKFGIGNGTVDLYVSRICTALLSLEKEVIFWPTKPQREHIAECLEEISKFKKCVGLIDGTSFTLINKPAVD